MTEYRIQDLPASERPRERLRSEGPGALTEAELLAIILRTGTETANVKQICHELLSELGEERLLDATTEELTQFTGIGEVKAGQIQAVAELSDRLDQQDVEELASVEDAEEVFIPRLRGLEQEELHAALLGSSNRIKRVETVFRGSLRSISIEPREVVRLALKHNASAVVIAHNHPDGDAEPTRADRDATHDIEEALNRFDIRLLDHLVVGERECTSLKQDGLL